MTSELSSVPNSLGNIMSATKRRLRRVNDSIVADADDPLSSSTFQNLVPRATPRPAIRDNISSNLFDEGSPLLCSARQGMFSKALYSTEVIVTKIQRYAFTYQHRFYLLPRIIAYIVLMLGAGALKHYYIDGLPNDHWFLTLRTGKKNPLNVYFIKLGWLWTWITLIPFCLLTRFVYSWRQSDNPNTTTNKTSNFWFDLLSNCFYSSFRMAICTGIWYATTQSFVLYENKYGTCILNPGSNTTTVYTTRYECRHDGHHWDSFEISGHIFLMIFSNLMRIEELYYLFSKFAEFKQFSLRLVTQPSPSIYTKPYHFSFRSPFLVLTLICIFIMTLVTLIWDFMIIETSLFYHNWLQNLVATGIAIVWWLVVYVIPPMSWFRNK